MNNGKTVKKNVVDLEENAFAKTDLKESQSVQRIFELVNQWFV